MTPVEVRRELVEALKLDLVGPNNGTDLEAEVLPQAPSRWYLTGFLVPLEAGEDQKNDETAQDDIDSASGDDGGDDDTAPEPPAARRAFFPSSIGLSLLVAKATRTVKVEVHWGRLSRRAARCTRGRRRRAHARIWRTDTASLETPASKCRDDLASAP